MPGARIDTSTETVIAHGTSVIAETTGVTMHAVIELGIMVATLRISGRGIFGRTG